MDVENLKEINEEIIGRMGDLSENSKISKRKYSIFYNKIRTLEKLFEKKKNIAENIKESKTIHNPQIEFLLYSLSINEYTKTNLQDICESFIEIFQEFPMINARVMKLVKVFAKENKGTNNRSLDRISGIALNFYTLWKKQKITEEMDGLKPSIANVKLRKHVCRKLAVVLEKNKKTKREAQIEAISLEAYVRNQFPDMGDDYLRECKLLIKKSEIHSTEKS